jgi:hypothetical protein
MGTRNWAGKPVDRRILDYPYVMSQFSVPLLGSITASIGVEISVCVTGGEESENCLLLSCDALAVAESEGLHTSICRNCMVRLLKQ